MEMVNQVLLESSGLTNEVGTTGMTAAGILDIKRIRDQQTINSPNPL